MDAAAAAQLAALRARAPPTAPGVCWQFTSLLSVVAIQAMERVTSGPVPSYEESRLLKGGSNGLSAAPLPQVTCPGAHQVERVEPSGGCFTPGQLRLPDR